MASQTRGAQSATASATWYYLSSIRVADGSAAWHGVPAGSLSDHLGPYNFGFAIPADAIIRGVEVTLIGAMPLGDMPLVEVQVKKPGLVWSDDKGAADLLGSLGGMVLGGPTDLWGLDLTPAEVNHASFGVGLQWQNTSGASREIHLDYVGITVYYETDFDPPVISGITVDSGDGFVTWATDEPATSQIEYGATDALGSLTALDESLELEHGAYVPTESAGVWFRVRSADAANNLATSDALWLWRGPDGNWRISVPDDGEPPWLDVTPPVISGVRHSPDTLNLIQWQTDEPSTSRIEYGRTSALGLESALDAELVTEHGVQLDIPDSWLIAWLRIRSADESGNEATADYWLWRANPGAWWFRAENDGGDPPRAEDDGGRSGVTVDLMPATEIAEIVQNVQTIIATPRGSAPLYRTFGVNADYVDMPLAAAREQIAQEYLAAIPRWEPRVEVVSVSWAGDGLAGELSPTIRLRIVSTGQVVEV